MRRRARVAVLRLLLRVPFRRLNEEQQYKKYDWLEVRLVRNTTDPRPETYRPFDAADLEEPVGHMDTDDQWRERRKLLLKTARVYDRLDDVIAGAKANQISLAVFKPTRILDFVWEQEDRDWDPVRAGGASEARTRAKPVRRTTTRKTK